MSGRIGEMSGVLHELQGDVAKSHVQDTRRWARWESQDGSYSLEWTNLLFSRSRHRSQVSLLNHSILCSNASIGRYWEIFWRFLLSSLRFPSSGRLPLFGQRYYCIWQSGKGKLRGKERERKQCCSHDRQDPYFNPVKLNISPQDPKKRRPVSCDRSLPNRCCFRFVLGVCLKDPVCSEKDSKPMGLKHTQRTSQLTPNFSSVLQVLGPIVAWEAGLAWIAWAWVSVHF